MARGEAEIGGAQPLPYTRLTGRAGLVVALLCLINIVNFIDRQLPFVLIDSIKADLGLTDAQIGLIGGLSFALVYSFGSLPLAWAADRWSARNLLVIVLGIWSLMTAAASGAQSFGQLLVARIGVAAGEAGCTPAAHALIARSFASERRGLVLALFSIGVPIGAMIGLSLGGWINDVADWRTAFLFVGLPGVVLALVCWIALPDVRATGAREDAPGFVESFSAMFRFKSFRHMAAGSSLYSCGSYAMNVFAAAFLMRVHGLSAAQAGLGFGLAFGIGGFAGTFLGGVLADRLGQRDPRWCQRIPAIGQLLSAPCAIGAWLVPSPVVSVLLLGLAYLFGLLYFAASFATAQRLAPDRMRASASAVLLFCLTLVGASVGPVVVGWISDALTPTMGVQALRYAMCLMGITILWSALHFWIAAHYLPGELADGR